MTLYPEVVYILQDVSGLGKDGQVVINIGRTTNLERRIRQHNGGSNVGKWDFIGYAPPVDRLSSVDLETHYKQKFGLWQRSRTEQFWLSGKGITLLCNLEGINIIERAHYKYHVVIPEATPRTAYRMPLIREILMHCSVMGNTSTIPCSALVDRIINDMDLTDYDLEWVDTDGSRETRASKHIHWVRKQLTEEGMLTVHIKRGHWVATRKLIEYASKYPVVTDRVLKKNKDIIDTVIERAGIQRNGFWNL